MFLVGLDSLVKLANLWKKCCKFDLGKTKFIILTTRSGNNNNNNNNNNSDSF